MKNNTTKYIDKLKSNIGFFQFQSIKNPSIIYYDAFGIDIDRQ